MQANTFKVFNLKPITCVLNKRSFSTTNSLRIPELCNMELYHSCFEALATSCDIFTTLISKHAMLENIAHKTGFEYVSDLQQAIRMGQWNLSDSNQINAEINRLEDLSIDAQQYKIKGERAYEQLKESLGFKNLSTINQSRVLTVLADSKHLHFRSEIKLLEEPILTNTIQL